MFDYEIFMKTVEKDLNVHPKQYMVYILYTKFTREMKGVMPIDFRICNS